MLRVACLCCLMISMLCSIKNGFLPPVTDGVNSVS